MSDNDGTAKKGTAQDIALRGVLNVLREAGGGQVNRDDAVTREGVRYVIPERATLREASKFLKVMAEQQDEVTSFSRVYNARPWDGAHCAGRVMREVFGAVGHGAQVEQGFFGPSVTPPRMISVPSGPNGETVQVPWGEFTLPGFDDCKITFYNPHDAEKGMLFGVHVEGPKRFASEIEGLFNVIEEACKRYSLYRGAAIDGGENPEFIGVNIDPSKVVYSGDVQVQLQANVWSVIEDSDLQRAAGLPLKRSVLLHGPYGTGKSLFLGLTAKIATENGWTYIRCRPGKDDYRQVLQTAALYAPSVVAFEDVDTLASSESSATDVARLLDMFDGVTSKGVEIVALMTTNHPERIHKGMVRPGRLDAVIEISALDDLGIERLVRSLVPDGMLAPTVEFGQVAISMRDYMPAFIKEATDRAIRYALSRSKNAGTVEIDTEDLVNAANGLRPQLDLMQAANDHQGYQPPLDRVLRRVLAETVEAMFDGALPVNAQAVDDNYGGGE